MSVTAYSNAPLPDFLKADAYLTSDSNEFALNAADAKQYLDWCRRNTQHVIGLEAWTLTESGHDALIDGSFEGDAHACKATVDEFHAKHGEGVVYCVWVEQT